jgi:hypothetical protein
MAAFQWREAKSFENRGILCEYFDFRKEPKK